MGRFVVHLVGKSYIEAQHTLAGGVQGTHVKDIDALHLSDELQTLETGGLAEVGRDGTGLGTGGNQVILRLDLCGQNGDTLAALDHVVMTAVGNLCALFWR